MNQLNLKIYHQEQPIHQLWWRSLTEGQKRSRLERFVKGREHNWLILFMNQSSVISDVAKLLPSDNANIETIFNFFKREESPFLGRLVSYKTVFDHETLEWETVVSRIVSYEKILSSRRELQI